MPTFSAGFLSVAGDGEFAAQMAEEYGYKPDPWQGLILDQAFTEGVYQIGVSAPRQNGKNGFTEIIELYAPIVLGHKILHTAHQTATALEQYIKLTGRWYENPRQADLCRYTNVSHARGGEEIQFDNGGRIQFTTRSAVRGRGFSADWIILDEAQEMNEDEWAALVPTLTASPEARIVLIGTPPVSSRQGQGVIFQRFREKAYDGELGTGEVYAEWGVTDLERDDIMSPETWRRVNPAWDYRINKTIIRANSLMMDREVFAREHLGYWTKGSKNTIYKPDQWTAGIVKKTPTSEIIDRFAVGVKFAQDGESFAVAFGAVLNDGRQYVELIDLASTKKGMTQLLYIIANFAKHPQFVGVLSDGQAGTLNLVGDAEASGLFKPNLIEICRYNDKIAANGLLDILMNSELLHMDQEPLKVSVLSLDKYFPNKSGGFAYVSRIGKLIASEAAALALHWAKNRKPKPKRPKQTIW